jgi:AcrR family transcriptional regulator
MSARQPTETRQSEIVQAALALSSRTSPALITTAALAEALGLSQGAVFRHFPSKDAIWGAALDWVREHLLTRLQAAAARHGDDAVAALAAVFRAHVDFVQAHPGVPRLIFHELQLPEDSAAKQAVRTLLQAYRALLLELLGQGVASGRLDAGLDREAAATAFVGLIQGLVMQSMLGGASATAAMPAAAERVLALYLQALAGAAR